MEALAESRGHFGNERFFERVERLIAYHAK